MAPFRATLARLRHDVDRLLSGVGVVERETTIVGDAERYWTAADAPAWQSDSHWRSGSAFEEDGLWLEIGRRHLLLYE